MKRIIPVFLLMLTAFHLNAQNRTLKQVSSLQMSRTIDHEMPGTRGASVVWHPIQKKYYAAMAGNAAYPLCIFDAGGKRLSDDEQNCLKDIRGLWYNPEKKNIQGNCFAEGGWFEYKLNAKGMIDDAGTLNEGMHQPGEQCSGTYNVALKEIMFLDNGTVYAYSGDGNVSGNSVTIHWGKRKKDNAETQSEVMTPETYNYTSVIYTGIKGSELGFLNIDLNQIELYDFKEGYLSAVLSLPSDAVTEPNFNFAFTNNTYWLFNIEKRTWFGYR